MKRAISLMIIVAMLAMTACGKEESLESSNVSASNTLQSQDELKADNDINTESQNKKPEVNTESDYSIEPTEEILNAKFEDGKVQVGNDMVFQLITMTFKDVKEIVNNSSQSDRYEWEPYEEYVDSGTIARLLLDGEQYLMFALTYPVEPISEPVSIDECRLVYVKAGQENRFIDPDKRVVCYAGGMYSDGRNIDFDSPETILSEYKEVEGNEMSDNSEAWTRQGNPDEEDCNYGYKLKVTSPFGGVHYKNLEYTPYYYSYDFYKYVMIDQIEIVLSSGHSEKTYDEFGLNMDDFIMLNSLAGDR